MMLRQALYTFCLLVLPLTSLAQNNAKCNEIEDIIQKTINAINVRDTSSYRSLILDHDICLGDIKKNSSDTALYNELKDVNAYNHFHVNALESLIAKVDKVAPHSEMKLVSFDSQEEKISSEMPCYTVDVKVQIKNENRLFVLLIGKYKGCHFIFAPILDHFIKY